MKNIHKVALIGCLVLFFGVNVAGVLGDNGGGIDMSTPVSVPTPHTAASIDLSLSPVGSMMGFSGAVFEGTGFFDPSGALFSSDGSEGPGPGHPAWDFLGKTDTTSIFFNPGLVFLKDIRGDGKLGGSFTESIIEIEESTVGKFDAQKEYQIKRQAEIDALQGE